MTFPISTAHFVNGSLPQFSSYGSETILYLTKCDNVLCAKCATASLSTDEPAVAFGTFSEGAPVSCEDCGVDIESTYGEVA